MIPVELILLFMGFMLLISIISSKASTLLGVPALLLFIAIGMLAGSEGIVGIYFDDPWLAQLLGVLALVLILFSGGLDTDIDEIRPVMWSGLSLATIGVAVTALAVGWFLHWFMGFSLIEGIMIGSIVASTDAAAVFSVLRSGGVRLNNRLERLLEMESGSNDPMAVFLTVGFIALLNNPEMPVIALLPLFIRQMILGALAGYGMGRIMAWAVNRIRLNYEGLYPALTVALLLLTYGGTTLIGGNGFLAAYLAGLVMGRQDFIHKKSLLRFHDGLGWMMQIFMFLVLGLLVFPSELLPDIDRRLLIAAFLIFVARPISVIIATLFSRFSLRERLMICWVGLRGAAPIVLGTFPLLAGVPRADAIFNIVFFVVLTSVLVQGPLIVPIARLLGLQNPLNQRPRFPLEYESAVAIESQMVEMTVPPNSSVIGLQVVDLHLPDNALIVLIGRGNNFIVPHGSTVLEADDSLLVLADRSTLNDLRQRVNTLITS